MYEYSTWLYVNIMANLHHAFYMKLPLMDDRDPDGTI